MEAVHSETLIGDIQAIGADDLRHSQIRRGERRVSAAGDIEVPGTTEIILSAGATDRGIVSVVVHVELDFAFAPPAIVID